MKIRLYKINNVLRFFRLLLVVIVKNEGEQIAFEIVTTKEWDRRMSGNHSGIDSAVGPDIHKEGK